MERVEQFIPNPLRCYNCQKYGHHEDNCRGRSVRDKCAQQDPGHHIDNCNNPYRCANCRGDHPVYARCCKSWKLEKEILGIKHRNNIPYNEARKMIVGSKTTTYSQAVQHNKTQYNYERIVKKIDSAGAGRLGRLYQWNKSLTWYQQNFRDTNYKGRSCCRQSEDTFTNSHHHG